MMKLDDIKSLGLFPKTLASAEIDQTRLIVMDEFYKPGTSVPEQTIKRLIALRKMGLGFHSDANIIWAFVERFLRLICPYCGQAMGVRPFGGSGTEYTVNYACECGAGGHVRIASDAVSFEPPSSTE